MVPHEEDVRKDKENLEETEHDDQTHEDSKLLHCRDLCGRGVGGGGQVGEQEGRGEGGRREGRRRMEEMSKGRSGRKRRRGRG